MGGGEGEEEKYELSCVERDTTKERVQEKAEELLRNKLHERYNRGVQPRFNQPREALTVCAVKRNTRSCRLPTSRPEWTCLLCPVIPPAHPFQPFLPASSPFACERAKEARIANPCQIRELDIKLATVEAELAAVQRERDSLKEEKGNLSLELEKLEVRLAEANSKVAEEILLRVDVENRLQSLKEELNFRKKVYEEELRVVQKHSSFPLADSGADDRFQQHLLHVLQDIREQHEVQVQAYRQEMEWTLQAKIDNARCAAAIDGKALREVKEELREASVKITELTSQFSSTQWEANAAGNRAHELEAKLESERKAAKERLAQYEQKVEDLQATIQVQLQDYQDLLDIKLSLSMEIATYHKLLEVEEERLHLSPNLVLRKREAPSHSVQGSRKRKRVAFLEPIGESRNLSVQATTSGRIGIKDVDIDGMFVRLVNKSQEDQCMEGWTLKRQIGHQAKIEYTFPSDCVLSAGKTVTVWAASGGVFHNPPTDLLWKNQSSWGTGDDIRTFLLDYMGKEISVKNVLHTKIEHVEHAIKKRQDCLQEQTQPPQRSSQDAIDHAVELEKKGGGAPGMQAWPHQRVTEGGTDEPSRPIQAEACSPVGGAKRTRLDTRGM
uniref:lamin-B1-like n=1 Tax=Myxine glutinosa TaxID=7769 RepID=UPI00358F9558